MNVGDTVINPGSYGAYIVYADTIGYVALVLSGYASYNVVAEQYTSAKKFEYGIQGNKLTLTLQGDSSTTLRIFKLTI